MEPNQVITTEDEDGEFLTPDEATEQDLDRLIDEIVNEPDDKTPSEN